MAECASETATPGKPVGRGEVAARSLPSPTMIRALWTSTQSTSGATAAIRSSRRSEPRNRSNGCGMPTRPPWARISAIVSAGGRPRGTGRSRNAPMRSPSRGLALLADDHGQLRGEPSRDLAGSDRAVDPVVVGDREVGQAARSGRPDDRLRRGDASRRTPTCGRADRRSNGPLGVEASDSPQTKGSDLRDERLLEEVEVLQGEAGAEGDAVQRVLGDMAGDAGHLGQ